MKTLVIYAGPSQMPGPGYGEPIVAFLTAGSNNKKTGPMPTIWVMHAEVDPWEAVRTGMDAAVCGGCPQRKLAEPGPDGKRLVPQCYTYGNVLRAASTMLKAYHKGNYLDGTGYSARQLAEYLSACAHFGAAKAIRSCAYGDMAALPPAVWDRLDSARRHVGLGVRGYTHQWARASHLKQTHMASVHDTGGSALAQFEGWRTFLSNDFTAGVAPPDHVLCPASKEANHLTNCTACTLCSGAHRKTAPSVYIPDHGHNAKGKRLSLFGKEARSAPS